MAEHRERCLFWARVFEMPRADWVNNKDGTVRKVHYQPTEACLLAAEALRFYADTTPPPKGEKP